MATNENKVPVTVLTGFLGSGKTTLLNRILTEQHGKRIAVIENEFGEIGIDQALVINADEEIFEMNNGCICCTVRGDLIRILGSLMRRKDKFDHILVETTGLADPGPVAQTFFVDDDIGSQLRLDGIVTLVDAKHVALHIDDSEECQEQIAFADVIVINKTDLVSPEELDRVERRIRSMNAMARTHRAVRGNVPLDVVLDVGGFDLGRALKEKPTFLEPEYPFEWGGVYQLEPGVVAKLLIDDGPDSTMDVALTAAPSADEAGLKAGAERAARFWSRAPELRTSGGDISAGDAHVQLDLAKETGRKEYPLSVSEPGGYVLLTEHRPEEYSLRLEDAAGNELPRHAEMYFSAGHSHDETVTSVGIHLQGEVDADKLNAWMGQLLQKQGEDIFRMKGILAIAGQKNRFVFQGVHMLFDGQPDKPWGKNPRVNDLVFIGRRLDRNKLNEGFRTCLK
ncbi:MAG: GTP-binding protein [Myxococcaceae bacterium]